MKVEIPIKVLSLDSGFHLLVSVRVNGRPARVLIDTGASQTVFDKKQVMKFLKRKKLEDHDKLSTGLGTNEMRSHLVVIERMKLGKLVIMGYKTVVIDLSHVNVAYRQMKQKPIDGVLGSDILKTFNAVIDYGKKRLILR